MADNPFVTPFIEMADRISRNDKSEFGGVMLIVPPKGEPVAYFFLTTKPEDEEPFFWAQCKAKLDTVAIERMSPPDPFGMRR